MAGNDNNKGGGGGGQKATNGLQMGVTIDPENMTPNKLSGVAGIAGVMFLAAVGLNKFMPFIKRRLFGMADANAAVKMIAADDANAIKGAVIEHIQAGTIGQSSLRYIAKNIPEGLAKYGDDGKSAEILNGLSAKFTEAMTATKSETK